MSRSLPPVPGRAVAGLALVAFAALAFACSTRSEDDAQPAVAPVGATHVRVGGELDVGNLALIARAIRTAKSSGKKTLILDLDTPGGSIDVLWTIQKQLIEAEQDGVELVTWIHDHAASAGSLVALSSSRIYISSVGTIGGAMPVAIGAMTIEELPEGVREKEVSFLRAQFAAAAQKRGRPVALAMAMVDRDTEVRQVRIDGELRLITGDEWDTLREKGKPPELVDIVLPRGRLLDMPSKRAIELGLADGVADTLEQVLQKLGIPPAAVSAPLVRSPGEEFTAWLQRYSPLLLIAAFVLAYIELKVPGFGLPGILSIACFALLLVGQYLAGLAEVPHIVAVALGAALIAVEVFVVPGTLWLGIVGALLVIGGLVLGSVGPGFDYANAFDQKLVLDAMFRILASAAVAVVAVLVLSRFLPKTPMLRRVVLAPSTESAFAGAMPEASGGTERAARVGAVGRVISDLRPVGKVELDLNPGYEYEARSSGVQVQRGARVRVIEVSAARLVVEADEEKA